MQSQRSTHVSGAKLCTTLHHRGFHGPDLAGSMDPLYGSIPNPNYVCICNVLSNCGVSGHRNRCRSITDFCLESLDTRLHHASFSQTLASICSHSPVVLHNVRLPELAQEVLVMRDDDKLKVGMVFPFINDAWRHLSHPGPFARINTYSTKLSAKASIFSTSKAFVGSSSAKMPQFWPNESDSASRMMIEASIFCPAEHRPRMSISTWSFVMTTYRHGSTQ